MKIKIRNYRNNDKLEVLKILRSNTPMYFAVTEEDDFILYLDTKIDKYFVITINNEVLACGGINYLRNNTACLSWDMVSATAHSHGLGTILVDYRLNFLKETSNFAQISVRTSQYAFKFYEKFGFKVYKIETNYWADGIDLYEMEAQL